MPLAQRLGVTTRHLARLFVRHMGATPLEVALTRRVHFAKKLIDETSLPFDEVAYAAGYGSVRRFNDEIRRSFTRTPTALRRLARQHGAAAAGSYPFRLAYRPPYDWDGAMRYFAAHATPGVERVEPSRYARTIVHDGRVGTIVVTHAAADDALQVEVRFPETRALLGIVERVRRMFDLLAVPDVIANHLRADSQLRRALVAHPGVRCVRPWDGFELAVRTLVPDCKTAGRIASAFGMPLRATPLERIFPLPSQLQDAHLESRGVPLVAARAIRALARAVVNGSVRFDGVDSVKLASELGSRTPTGLKGTTLVGTIGPKACASDISDPTNKLLDAKL